MSDEREIRRAVSIQTTVALAFESLTRASELREWCSDEAWTEPRSGGRYDLRWLTGYLTHGTFLEFDSPHRAVVSWWGTGEPARTQVEFSVEAGAQGVEVTLMHTGFGTGDQWDRVRAEAEKGWTDGLENLKSTLETGLDLRITRRPFLGIYFEYLDEERAKREGLGVLRGIYLSDTVEGSGARSAGLGKGDVIVAIGDLEVTNFDQLASAIRNYQIGDVVDVHIVRGQERMLVPVTMGQRPIEDLPANAEELAEALGKRHQEKDAELAAALEGLTEAQAERRPSEGEWSVKEVLAHLSLVERDQQAFVSMFALDGWVDTGPGNATALEGRLAAVLSVTHTLEALHDRYITDEAETLAFAGSLPLETLAHKARFRRIASVMLGLPDHTSEHVTQIKAAAAAARVA